jgi:hypothetical protein
LIAAVAAFFARGGGANAGIAPENAGADVGGRGDATSRKIIFGAAFGRAASSSSLESSVALFVVAADVGAGANVVADASSPRCAWLLTGGTRT